MNASVSNGFYQTRLMPQSDAEQIAARLSTDPGILRAEAVPAPRDPRWFVLVIPAGFEGGYPEVTR